MRPALLFVLAAALVAGLLAYLALGDDPARRPAVLAPGGIGAPAAVEEPERSEPTASGSLPAREEVAAAAPPPEASPEPAIVPSAEQRAAAPVLLIGRVVVTDQAGVEHPTEEGTGQLVVWLGDTGTYRDVVVRAGGFALEVPGNALVAPGTFELGGRAAVVEGARERRALPPDGQLELRARWPGGVRLHVVSAATGAELEDVELWVAEEVPFATATRPPGARAVRRTEAASSPLPVAPYADGPGYQRSRVHARAPGHAWGTRVVDHDRGGDAVLELAPAGALDVHLVGDVEGVAVRLRELRVVDPPTGAQRIEGPVVVDRPTAGEAWVGLEDLVPATYLVRAELGDAGRTPLVLAEAEVEVPADQRPSTTLVLDPRPEVELVRLTGTLELPEAWGIRPFGLYLTLVDEPLAGQRKSLLLDLKAAPDAPDRFTWDAGEVQAGAYGASLMEVRHRMALDVPAGAPVERHLVVPPPARVLLEVVDAATGEPAEVQEVQWHIGPSPLGSTTLERVTRPEDSDAFEFFVAPGEVFVAPFGGGYGGGEAERFEARAGTNRWTLEVSRGLGFRIVLCDAGELVPPPPFAAMTMATRVDEAGTSTLTTRTDSGIEYRVRAPGRYRVQLPAPPGYEAPAAIEVTVAADSFDSHDLALVPKP